MNTETTPCRIQRKRTKGWKMPDNTISVTRPGKWGNPFSMAEEVELVGQKLRESGMGADIIHNTAQLGVVNRFRDMMNDLNSHDVPDDVRARFRFMRDRIKDLQGKNLACYCAPGSYCHADVLLKLANQ